MALERVAVLEEELELSNQEVGAGSVEKGRAMSGWRTKKLIGCILKEAGQWDWIPEKSSGPQRRNSVCSGVLTLVGPEPSRPAI